ncbi:MAG: MarR family transcriptional regulator [Cyanobacterium sp. T60_A2020_053]|nr:MarR family transcriptional regulator [Cyanobacterium sp. T60_A2020_053]
MGNFSFRGLRQTIKSWLTQNQNNSDNEEKSPFVEVSRALVNKLNRKIDNLSSPQGYQKGIRDELTQRIEDWQNNLDGSNSLVVLGNPVENIAQIISDSISEWQNPLKLKIITPFSLHQRPSPITNIKKEIKQAFKISADLTIKQPENQQESEEKQEDLEQRISLIIIPNLDQCFLRAIGGWESIIILRNIVVDNPHCFWLMGCNHWAWNFLDLVCQIKAYFGEGLPLPSLTGEELGHWLEDLAPTTIEAQFWKNLNLSQDDSSNVSEEERRKTYWHDLAIESQGVSSIAVSLWLQSLRLAKEVVENENINDLNIENLDFRQVKPCLPMLPPLSSTERYLLHAVLIHGRINRPHLALSLGESESHIEAKIQNLLRLGVLQKRLGALVVQPAYYEKVKNELANNNFFVGELI